MEVIVSVNAFSWDDIIWQKMSSTEAQLERQAKRVYSYGTLQEQGHSVIHSKPLKESK